MSKNWDLVPLKNILKPVSRKEKLEEFKQYKLLGVRLDGCGAFLREIKNGSEISATTLYRVEKGDFIYSRLFASRGAFSLIDSSLDGCYVSGEFPTFQGIENKIDLQFLYYWFRLPPVLKQVESDCSGSTSLSRNRYKQEFFLQLQIPLPPLEEQRRIVGKIESLAEKIEEVRSLRLQTIKETEDLIISSRIKIFDQALKRNAKRFDEVAYLERGKFSHRPRNEPRFFGGQHRWIQIAEIESSGKYIKHWQETLNDEGLAISRKFPKGTLLISIAATIGAVGILTFDCCIPDSIVAITPKENVSSEYLYYYLCYLRTSLEKIAPQSAQKNINLRILQPLPVPVMPLSEQKRIVEYLDRLQSKIEIMKKEREKALEETEALLPSILDKAFKGEL